MNTDAPQLAATDDAIERIQRFTFEDPDVDPAEEFVRLADVRAALAAAGAGVEVDREALARRLWEVDHPDGQTFEGGGPWVQVAHDLADAALDTLAARGDAVTPVTVCASCGEGRDDVIHCSDCYAEAAQDTTPTEVQWGVRHADGTIDLISEDDASSLVGAFRRGLVQRTVSAWREVS